MSDEVDRGAAHDSDELDTEDLDTTVGFSSFEIPSHAGSTAHVAIAGRSHTGLVREKNEDHYLVFRTRRTFETLLSNLPKGSIPEKFEESGYAMLVADGMGGAQGGAVASRQALSLIISLALRRGEWKLKLDERQKREVIERVLGILRDVDRELSRRSAADPSLEGMGTTLTATYSVGTDLLVFQVGDSRAYLIRDGQLTRLTRDQTMAQMLADFGHISAEPAETDRRRHMLTQAMGRGGGSIKAEVGAFRLLEGDSVLLCSDGLTEHVDDSTIADIVSSPAEPDAACKALIDLALEGGGRDNITVTLARYSFTETE